MSITNSLHIKVIDSFQGHLKIGMRVTDRLFINLET